MTLKKSILFSVLGLFLLMCNLNAQVLGQTPRDLFYDRISPSEKEIIPYDHIRESDVFYHKRIWRVIDVREKMNLPFKYPKEPFVEILRQAAINGEINVYENEDFVKQMTSTAVAAIGAGLDSVPETDSLGNPTGNWKKFNKTFNPENVKRFRLKEDWFFDEETSTMQVRIIGIAPITDIYDDQGNYRGPQAMFWIYFPDARKYLVKKEVFNSNNDAIRLSWDDLFEMRVFSSYIYKESNVFERRIEDYAEGIDRLYESERIKTEIFNFEHDLWSY